MKYPDLKRAVVAQRSRFPKSVVIVEEKASGIQLIQELGRELRMRPYSPPSGADKLVRLHIQTDKFASGRVLLPTRAPWLQAYIAELTGFPNTKYDDQVDSTTQFLDFIGRPGAFPMQISKEALERIRRMPKNRNW